MKRLLSFLMGSVMGALVGATLAILLAPQSGEDLREEMRQRFQKMQDEVKQAAAGRRIELERQLSSMRQSKEV
ncbi:MAG: YtxH domain-containing protein [Anaerolineae bacterium]|nr:YtxH domain-containing protein [Anaerolineae bacterium]